MIPISPYLVPQGTPGYVRKAGTKKWTPYITKTRFVFGAGEPHGSTHLILREGDWEFLVSVAHVNNTPKDRVGRRVPDKGRGVGKRAALRLRKRHGKH